MISEILATANEKMGKAIEAAKEDFGNVRTGRANPQLFQKVMVDYYGTPTPLAQLGQLANPEARTIVITPYDKSALKAIEQALREMPNLDANPQNDGNLIRVVLPDLTEERRKEYVKVVKNMAEDGRIALRNVRRDARKVLETSEKDGDISKDDLDRAEKELDKLTQEHVEQIEKAFARKEQELLEV